MSFAMCPRSSGLASTRCPKGPPSRVRSCRGRKARRSRKSLTSIPRPRPSCRREETARAAPAPAPAPAASRAGAMTSRRARPRKSRARSSSITWARATASSRRTAAGRTCSSMPRCWPVPASTIWSLSSACG
ncbi:hypothetical protein GBAR_LOCUS31303 [Geodia barretti]|uniref:Uncharacterized protein n=2 Tax=Geodia barretti TaxID=519541 RepID=A0AA35XM17_GEOBA|nr:hypothetical protein GBAR_LOCUS31303 [Geodia barretti]